MTTTTREELHMELLDTTKNGGEGYKNGEEEKNKLWCENGPFTAEDQRSTKAAIKRQLTANNAAKISLNTNTRRIKRMRRSKRIKRYLQVTNFIGTDNGDNKEKVANTKQPKPDETHEKEDIAEEEFSDPWWSTPKNNDGKK